MKMRHFPAADAAMCERIVRGISEKAMLRPWPLALHCVPLSRKAALRPVVGFVPEPRPWECVLTHGRLVDPELAEMAEKQARREVSATLARKSRVNRFSYLGDLNQFVNVQD